MWPYSSKVTGGIYYTFCEGLNCFIIKDKTGDERIAMTMMQEISKDRRMDEMREEREIKNGEPVTTKQLKFMKKLGIEAQPGLTKKQASMLIDEELGKDNEM